MKKKFSERRYGALKKGAARFWKRAAPMKATGGVTPVADFYQKSMVALLQSQYFLVPPDG